MHTSAGPGWTQLDEHDRVLDRYLVRGAGPRGGSSFRLGHWLQRWKGQPVRVLIDRDCHEIVVVLVQRGEDKQ